MPEQTPVISYVVDSIKPETSAATLREVEQVIKVFGNKKVTNIHIDGNGSKYLYVYTAPPALIIRASNHPTGCEHAKEVKSKFALFAEAIRAFSKIK